MKQWRQMTSQKPQSQRLEQIDDILNNPSLAEATGASSLAVIPGTGAYDITKQIESLKSKQTIENMGMMKGVLSDADIKNLDYSGDFA